MKRKWEDLTDDNFATTLRRTKVPWGWLVMAIEEVIHNRMDNGQGMIGGWDWRTSITFVFDPFHWWKV